MELGYVLADLAGRVVIMTVPRMNFATLAIAGGVISRKWEEKVQNDLLKPGTDVFMLRGSRASPGQVIPDRNPRLGYVCVRGYAGNTNPIYTLRASKVVPFESPGKRERTIPQLPFQRKEHRNLFRYLFTGINLCVIAGRKNRLLCELKSPLQKGNNRIIFADIIRCRGVPDSFHVPGRVCKIVSHAGALKMRSPGSPLIAEVYPGVDVHGLAEHFRDEPCFFLIDRSRHDAAETANNIDNLFAHIHPDEHLPFTEKELPSFCEIVVFNRKG